MLHRPRLGLRMIWWDYKPGDGSRIYSGLPLLQRGKFGGLLYQRIPELDKSNKAWVILGIARLSSTWSLQRLKSTQHSAPITSGRKMKVPNGLESSRAVQSAALISYNLKGTQPQIIWCFMFHSRFSLGLACSDSNSGCAPPTEPVARFAGRMSTYSMLSSCSFLTPTKGRRSSSMCHNRLGSCKLPADEV